MATISRRLFSLAALCISLSLCAGLSQAADNPKVLFKTNKGEIVVELYPEMAPKTVANFVEYVKSGHYNGTIFHRVINNFMVQGGGFDKKMKEKPTKKPIPLEAAYALQKGLKNDVGTIAMARTNDPNSATAQFFINVNDNDFLNHQELAEPDKDGLVTFTRRGMLTKAPRAEALMATAGYAPFGRVIQGMEVVDLIKAVPTQSVGGFDDVPVSAIVIESAKLIK